MQNDFDWSSFGFHTRDIIAGFMGGIANSFVYKKSKPWAIIGSVVVGGISANYLSPVISNIFGTSSETSAFLVGLTGMAVCQHIVESARSWKLFKGPGNG